MPTLSPTWSAARQVQRPGGSGSSARPIRYCDRPSGAGGPEHDRGVEIGEGSVRVVARDRPEANGIAHASGVALRPGAGLGHGEHQVGEGAAARGSQSHHVHHAAQVARGTGARSCRSSCPRRCSPGRFPAPAPASGRRRTAPSGASAGTPPRGARGRAGAGPRRVRRAAQVQHALHQSVVVEVAAAVGVVARAEVEEQVALGTIEAPGLVGHQADTRTAAAAPPARRGGRRSRRGRRSPFRPSGRRPPARRTAGSRSTRSARRACRSRR